MYDLLLFLYPFFVEISKINNYINFATLHHTISSFNNFECSNFKQSKTVNTLISFKY